MKIFVVGATSPTGKEFLEFLRAHKIRFSAPPDKNLDPDNAVAIAKLVTDYAPTQLVNLADFISGNHSALIKAESSAERCIKVNSVLPATLAEICDHLNIPMLHLSNSYVFDGVKKLAYNEQDATNPQGVYGNASLSGELAVQQHNAHIILRSGWLFGNRKKGLIKSWIRAVKKNGGQLQVVRRRFSPTPTSDLASAILAVCQQLDCDARVWGTYHYAGLETKKENEFVKQTIRYAANHDEEVYQLLDSLKITDAEAKSPEILNSTLSGKKMSDTFGIKQKTWHVTLKEAIKTLYVARLKTQSGPDDSQQVK